MAVQINSWNPPNGYPELKGEYIDKYYDLVLLKAPENQSFSMHELYDFPLQSEERSWYNIVSNDVMVALISDDLIKFETGSNIYLRLTTKGKNKRKGITENQTIITKNYIGGNNYGFQSSESDLIKPATQNANKTTAHNNPKRSFLEIASWVFGIVVAVIVIYEFIIKN